ncbi:MAG: PIN domain-containing protein, partial [Candidatus Daviesbacteria bacterium]|nr:PIN domain-containing protein [Candidatus Daviesbacteria bacterium]
MAGVKRLLVDADAFVALVRPDDSNYLRAKNFSNEINALGFELVTSDPAFGEAVTVISQKQGLEEAISFAERVLQDPIEIVEVDASLRRKALDIFKKQTS